MADRLAGYVAGNDPKFKAWMAAVDAAVSRMVGLSVMDLPDLAFYDLFKDGVRPSSAAKMAVREAGGF